jgi:tyrosine-protein phosphatase SIW14
MRPFGFLFLKRTLRAALLLPVLAAGLVVRAEPPRARVAGDVRPGSCVTAQPGAPLPERQTGTPHGVQNFGQVTSTLYRGAQPTSEGYRELKDLGVEIVVSFRQEKGENEHERTAVEGQKMRFISIPWNAFRTPTDDQVRQYLEVIRANPGKKIFVHCQQGRDRTGTMVAVYRITAEHWCVESAVREMRAYNYHHFWFPQLERYVRGYSAPAASNAQLGGAAPAAQSSTP